MTMKGPRGEQATIVLSQAWMRKFTYRLVEKNFHTFVYALTSVNTYALTSSVMDRFSNLFHFLSHSNIFNNTVTKYLTTPPVCRYTILSIKSNNWKQDDFCSDIF